MIAVPPFVVRPLAWSDEEIGLIDLPKAPLRMTMGFGSGLTRRATDPPGIVWAVGDRGPNLKAKTLVEHYGLERMRDLAHHDGAKVMPRLDVGPAIAKLRVLDDRVELIQVLRLTDADGLPISGLPVPSSEHARNEPAFDLDARPIDADPSGLDTEGIVGFADGGFMAGDEFGPSLVRIDRHGRVETRYVPHGVELEGARYTVQASLPAIAAKRQLNRGFEAIALSPDERWLYLAFQSPLAHPDKDAHDHARHVRLWRLDAATLEVAGQYIYPLDDPASFLRDLAEGPLNANDLKVSELVCLGDDRLLVLERGSQTTKIYQVHLTDDDLLPVEHLDASTRPTVEEKSARGDLGLPQLDKGALFTSDDAPELGADLEGMVALSPTELLLVNDNDFGVEGATTGFWVVQFTHSIVANQAG